MLNVIKPNTLCVSIIAALGARTRAIGNHNALLWRIPGDLPRFKRLTMGHPVVMGHTTFLSIGHPLPGRTNIVLTHDPTWTHDDVVVCRNLDEAFDVVAGENAEQTFVIGGGSVYTQTIEYADRLYLTLVHDDAEGDTFFPTYTHIPWKETAREEHGETTPPFAWVTLERTRGGDGTTADATEPRDRPQQR